MRPFGALAQSPKFAQNLKEFRYFGEKNKGAYLLFGRKGSGCFLRKILPKAPVTFSAEK